MGRLEGKVAIITGGASNPSLGRSTSLTFAREGATVVLTDIDIEGGKKVENEINESGGKALFLEHDVTSIEDWEKVKRETLKNFQKVDILVNNAGIAILKSLEETTEDDWDKTIDVNLKSIFLGCKTIAPSMREQENGSIINISSVAGIVGLVNASAYNSSKGGVRLLTKNIALEYGSYNIRCNSVHPGFMATNMNDPKKIIERGRDLNAMLEAIPLKRMGTADDIANCALFLASDESSYVTGSEFTVDGGMTAQ
ncbi:MAG: SDR family NAD(P)-dependent oxidoreductase [Alphaproteobacteria bacterium]|jgi:NAD(P)-dependent dehydrogenase (short-subunit alcohol dehydrogenase family)